MCDSDTDFLPSFMKKPSNDLSSSPKREDIDRLVSPAKLGLVQIWLQIMAIENGFGSFPSHTAETANAFMILWYRYPPSSRGIDWHSFLMKLKTWEKFDSSPITTNYYERKREHEILLHSKPSRRSNRPRSKSLQSHFSLKVTLKVTFFEVIEVTF